MTVETAVQSVAHGLILAGVMWVVATVRNVARAARATRRLTKRVERIESGLGLEPPLNGADDE